MTNQDRAVPSIDSVALRTLDQAVLFYGIRAAVLALRDIADACAKSSAENHNTVQAKQWAAWANDLDEVAIRPDLFDPGRE